MASLLGTIILFFSLGLGIISYDLDGMAFIDFWALLMVVGGCWGVLISTYSFNRIAGFFSPSRAAIKLLNNRVMIMKELLDLANLVRKEGLAVAEASLPKLQFELFRKLTKKIIDGADPGSITRDLETEYQKLHSPLNQALDVADYLIRVIPTVGLLSTLILFAGMASRTGVSMDFKSVWMPLIYSTVLLLLVHPAQIKFRDRLHSLKLFWSGVEIGIHGIQNGLSSQRLEDEIKQVYPKTAL